MSVKSKNVGTVDNPTHEKREVSVPGTVLILGGALVGTYIGVQVGGPMGAAAGALVGAFVGALGSGIIKRFKVTVYPDGRVEVEYETWVG